MLIDPNTPGAYKMDPIPVGTVLLVLASAPGGFLTINPATFAWSGGTDYARYFADSAADPPVGSFQVTKNPPTTNSSYSFIVDATPRTYTVSVSLKYVNPCGGADLAAPDSTLTFSSIAPTVSGIEKTQSTPQVNRGNGFVRLALENGAERGMRISVTTSTTSFGGKFMFMQMISPQRFGQDGNGVTWYQPAQGAGPAIDDSYRDANGFDGAIGYPITEQQEDPDYPGHFIDRHWWDLRPDESFRASMGDSPFVSSSLSSNILQVGNFDANVPESFDTYVMYKPTNGGVWVGLAKIHWAWGGQTNDGENVNPMPNIPPPTFTNPLSGDDQFPGWTDRATAILGRGWRRL